MSSSLQASGVVFGLLLAAASQASAQDSGAPGQHKKDVEAFVGSWQVKHSATTSACQDAFLLEHPDPSTISLFHLDLGTTTDLVSDDGDCSFTWYVQGGELRARAGQFCMQELPDTSEVEVGLIYAHGSLQSDGTAEDSILVSVTLYPAEGTARTCLVTIEETLVKISQKPPTSMAKPGKGRSLSKSKYADKLKN